MTHSVLRAFILVALILSLFPVGSVGAEVMPGCSMTPTVEALRACMQHCYESGEITNAKVAGSLLGELQAAQVAVDRGHPRAAIYLLELFVVFAVVSGGLACLVVVGLIAWRVPALRRYRIHTDLD